MWKAIKPQEEHGHFNADSLNTFVTQFKVNVEASQAMYFYRENSEVKFSTYTHTQRNPRARPPPRASIEEAQERIQKIVDGTSGIRHLPKFVWAMVVLVCGREGIVLLPVGTNQRAFDIEPLVVN